MRSARSIQYHTRCEALRQKLGGKCAICGTPFDLQFDSIVPAGREHHLYGSLARIRWYEIHADHGKLQLLCVRHHTEKNIREIKARRAAKLTPATVPVIPAP